MVFIFFYIFCLGLIWGSFINALIWRLHSGESMMERSKCPKCHELIKWYDNIPLLSYLLLAGKCRSCNKVISWQYPLVELTTGILFVLVWQYGGGINLMQSLLLGSNDSYYWLLYVLRSWFVVLIMTLVFVYDLRWYMILDKVTYPSSVVLAVFSLLLFFFENGTIFGFPVVNTLLALLVGGGFFAAQFYGSKGRWVGGGDVKLGIVMALVLGWPNIVGALFLAYIVGAIFGLSLIAIGKKDMSSKMPFGTFLAIATVVMLIWGSGILNWYYGILGF